MYLVDTSVWIDYFRERNNIAVKRLTEIINRKLAFGITSVIYQEILQGAASKQDLNQLILYFSTQQFFYPKDNISSYESAAKIYFDCRRKGITIRSTIDCLIAQIAIEHDLILLHNDADFNKISKVTSTIKIVH